MDTLKLFAIIFITAVICIILKQYKPEYSIFATVICSVIILTFIFKKILIPITLIKQKIEACGIESSYFKVALKSLGIGYLTTFIADSCRDAGQVSLAFKSELVGKFAIFILSVPLIFSILETAIGFVK